MHSTPSQMPQRLSVSCGGAARQGRCERASRQSGHGNGGPACRQPAPSAAVRARPQPAGPHPLRATTTRPGVWAVTHFTPAHSCRHPLQGAPAHTVFRLCPWSAAREAPRPVFWRPESCGGEDAVSVWRRSLLLWGQGAHHGHDAAAEVAAALLPLSTTSARPQVGCGADVKRVEGHRREGTHEDEHGGRPASRSRVQGERPVRLVLVQDAPAAGRVPMPLPPPGRLAAILASSGSLPICRDSRQAERVPLPASSRLLLGAVEAGQEQLHRVLIPQLPPRAARPRVATPPGRRARAGGTGLWARPRALGVRVVAPSDARAVASSLAVLDGQPGVHLVVDAPRPQHRGAGGAAPAGSE